MNDDHHVFINLETLKVYVLPDGYEVHESSLNDIKHVVKPIFTQHEITKLDQELYYSKDLYGKKYIPGFVGLNNMKQNDYIV
jgi:U4/U6.U5 tri-snRNP-associated protein 2